MGQHRQTHGAAVLLCCTDHAHGWDKSQGWGLVCMHVHLAVSLRYGRVNLIVMSFSADSFNKHQVSMSLSDAGSENKKHILMW